MLLGFDVGSLYEFEKTVRQKTENHGKAKRKTATTRTAGNRHFATTGELGSAPQNKESAAAASKRNNW